MMEQFAVLIGTPEGVQWVMVGTKAEAVESAQEQTLKPDEVVMVIPVLYHRSAE